MNGIKSRRGKTTLSGFYSHIRCFILIEEAEMVGGGKGCPAPAPSGCVRLLYINSGREEREEGRRPPFLLLSTPPPPTQ